MVKLINYFTFGIIIFITGCNEQNIIENFEEFQPHKCNTVITMQDLEFINKLANKENTINIDKSIQALSSLDEINKSNNETPILEKFAFDSWTMLGIFDDMENKTGFVRDGFGNIYKLKDNSSFNELKVRITEKSIVLSKNKFDNKSSNNNHDNKSENYIISFEN